MDAEPYLFHGLYECVLFLVGDLASGLPSQASVQHVEDDVLLDEYQVTLYFDVELIWQVDGTYIAGSWFLPLSAYSAGVHSLVNHVQHFLCDSNTFKELLHCQLRGMPPTYVELS